MSKMAWKMFSSFDINLYKIKRINNGGWKARLRLLDAITLSDIYADFLLARVRLYGDMNNPVKQTIGDSIIAENMEVLWYAPVGKILRKFACDCALEVAHMWNPPQKILKCLKNPTIEMMKAHEMICKITNDDYNSGKNADWRAASNCAKEATRHELRYAVEAAIRSKINANRNREYGGSDPQFLCGYEHMREDEQKLINIIENQAKKRQLPKSYK